MNTGYLQPLEADRFPGQISQDMVVRLQFRVTDAGSGHLLQYGNDLIYLHGGYGGAFPKIEEVLEGCRVGDRRQAVLSPEDGYGSHDPDLVLEVPEGEFAGHALDAGTQIEGSLPDGRIMLFSVRDVCDGRVVLDGNHPFAGKTLNFEFEVLRIRNSSETERSTGHPLYAID